MITIAATLSFGLPLHRAMHLHGLETPTGWQHKLMNDATCNTLHIVEFSAGHQCMVGNQVYRTRQPQTHVLCIVHCICSCVGPGIAQRSVDQKYMWFDVAAIQLQHSETQMLLCQNVGWRSAQLRVCQRSNSCCNKRTYININSLFNFN